MMPAITISGWNRRPELYNFCPSHGEKFRPEYDATTINQRLHQVDMHKPDGKPDILQQIEHGVLTILGAYENMGRVYRGIISPTIPQYSLVGDVSTQTNNLVYKPSIRFDGTFQTIQGIKDDRMVFTEENPSHEYSAIQGLACAARVLKEYDESLSVRCLKAAENLWKQPRTVGRRDIDDQIGAASELLITTGSKEYKDFLLGMTDSITRRISSVGWMVVRTIPVIKDAALSVSSRKGVTGLSKEINDQEKETPFGVPYRPHIWGAGWNIQEFGVHQYYLSKYFPGIV